MFLVAGLGNPGDHYRKNRHNAGFMVVDQLAVEARATFSRVLKRSLTCKIERFNQSILLAKPQTYMNLSGGAVLELLRHYEIETSQTLVIYDDFALPLGKIRLRPSGSSGRHRGIESIIQALGTHEVPRLRLGIGTGDVRKDDYRDFVLSDFPRHLQEELDNMLDRAVRAVDVWVSDGIGKAMSMFNG